MIGNGKLQGDVEEQIRNLGLEERSKILSNRTDIPDLLNSMDRFVFPSIFEGLGIVLIEAQRAGIKCVASSNVPKAAVVSNLVKQLDLTLSAENWADEIINLEVDAIEYQGIDEWDMRNVINKLEDLYQS